MRIAIVNQPFDGVLPPDQNSIGIWTYETARRLSHRHQLFVHAPYTGPVKARGEGRRIVDQGVSYHFWAAAPVRVWGKLGTAWERLRRGKPLYASSLYYLEYSLQVAVALRRQRPDVVHIHNMTGFLPVIRLLNRRAAFVLHMNGEWLSQLDRATMQRRISRVSAVFGSSNHITRLITSRFPDHADRCHTVYNGVDPDAFTAGESNESSSRTIVWVGRISPEKGLHDLLEAMAIVVQRQPSAQLVIIGPEGSLPRSFIVDVTDDPLIRDLARFYDREYKQHLDDQVAAHGLAEHVHFAGGMSHQDVIDHVRAADVVANPSYSESFGMSLVEALACSTPVVATRVGGMPEIVGDDAGLLIERNDPAALADALEQLLGDPAQRRRMGGFGRRRVEDVFAWSVIAQRADAIYSELPISRRS